MPLTPCRRDSTRAERYHLQTPTHPNTDPRHRPSHTRAWCDLTLSGPKSPPHKTCVCHPESSHMELGSRVTAASCSVALTHAQPSWSRPETDPGAPKTARRPPCRLGDNYRGHELSFRLIVNAREAHEAFVLDRPVTIVRKGQTLTPLPRATLTQGTSRPARQTRRRPRPARA